MANNQIALLAQAPVFDTPFESQGKALQLRQLMNAGMVQDMDMQQKRQAIADDAATRDIYARTEDPADRIKALYKINPKAAQVAQKAQFDLDKIGADIGETKAKTTKTQGETASQAFAMHRDRINLVKTPQDAAQWVQENFVDPVTGPIVSRVGTLEQALSKIPTDPQEFLKWKLQAGLKADEYVKQTSPDANTRLTSETSIGNNKRTVAASYANAGATRAIAEATRDAAKIQTGFANEQGLRKEFEGLPEVKNYKMAYPAYAAIKDATSRNTTQSDINIVYGLAKLYDPTSVVREGEYATVANSPNIPEKVKGYAQYLAGGGKLSSETKKQILTEATGRINTYQAEAKKAKGSYEGIAKKRGMDPSSVFADMGEMGSKPSPTKPGASSVMDQADAILGGK